MYPSGSFDGAAAFSGGGFMPSQATQSIDPSFFPAKNRETQALLPLTIKQINQAMMANDDKSNFIIDGVDVNNVTLVGMVFNKADRVTDITFVVDDGTGRIDCTRWVVQEVVEAKEMEGILNGMYVRVHGHLKGFQGKRTLNVFSIRPVIDFNEIANHFLECIYVHLYNTKLRKLQGGDTTQSHMKTTPSKSYQATPSNQFSGQHGSDVLEVIADKVLQFLQQPIYLTSEIGAHVEAIAQNLNVPVKKIREAIPLLQDNGCVYETVDGDHFKSTGNA